MNDATLAGVESDQTHSILTRFLERKNRNTFTGMLRKTVFVFAALVVLAGATQVYHCDSETSFEDATQVNILNCNKPECLLKQGTSVVVEIKPVPNKDIQTLPHEVSSPQFNVPYPFVYIDEKDACNNIFNADGSKAGCPLKKGVEYTYIQKKS